MLPECVNLGKTCFSDMKMYYLEFSVYSLGVVSVEIMVVRW